ncbi:MAG: DinB family protein [Isosphaeraceae bacterium]
MQVKDAILTTLAMSERVQDRYLADLSDADLLVRPVEGQNHIAWQLGHLILSEHRMLEGIKPGSSPALPDHFEEAHGRDEESTRADDPGRFLPKEKYLELFQAQRAATKSVLAAMSDTDLDAPAPESLRQMVPTAGATLVLIGTHTLMHVGQFVSVRRKLKKPLAI